MCLSLCSDETSSEECSQIFTKARFKVDDRVPLIRRDEGKTLQPFYPS